MDIKPIETVYNGYRFRSRLEARWAVFFDKLDIPWQYELEGFDLDSIWYLPDFYLTNLKCWIEIKPDYYTPDFMWDGEENKTPSLFDNLENFSQLVGPIICFGGMPSLSWNGLLFCQDSDDSGGGIYQCKVGFAWCNKCNHATLSISDAEKKFLSGRRSLVFPDWNSWDTYFCDPEHRDFHSILDIEHAVNSAKQARFEHH